LRAHRISFRIGVLLLGAALVLVEPASAFAAVPTNDTYPGAIPIGALPFTTTLDTTEATTDADDANANDTCGAPATDASVWYALSSGVDGAALVDVSASSYSAGVLVVTGAPGAFQIVACGPRRIAFPVSAGTTYHLLIIDDQADGGGNGGALVLTVDSAPPPPVIAATVDPTGAFDPHAGTATVHGTIMCSGVVDFAFVDVQVRQPVGRGEVTGVGSLDVRCNGSVNPWSVEVVPDGAGTKFSGGKAASLTFAVACGPLQCSVDFQEYDVRLSRQG
jgi:hypothetical protein